MLKKNKAPNKKKLFREIKKNIAVVKSNLKDIKETNNELLAHIDKINEIWNRNRPEEIKAADEIQPDKLITLLQEYVHRQGTALEYEAARERYIYESKRWAQINRDIKARTDEVDALRDTIRGKETTLFDSAGNPVKCWIDCAATEENFDKNYRQMVEAHVEFGKSLAILDKRVAAGILFWNEILKEFPKEIPADTGLMN